MPIYEYHCAPCQHTFETLIRSPGDPAHCPKCGGHELDKLFSVPAAAHSSPGAGQSALPVCDAGPSFGCGQGRCATGMCSFDD
jgi:putative FmdB family regulatory protein